MSSWSSRTRMHKITTTEGEGAVYFVVPVMSSLDSSLRGAYEGDDEDQHG